MKKIAFIILAGLTILSCNKKYNDSDLPEGGPATFHLEATSDTYYEKLAKNGTQEITFAAVTSDTGVKQQLTASFKMGGSDLVALYNSSVTPSLKALEFPAGACKFVKNDVTIDRYNKSSRSAKIAVTNTSEMLKDTLYVLPVILESVKGSELASAETDQILYFVFFALGLDKGNGSKDKPYLIYDADDFKNMVSQTLPVDAAVVKTYAARTAAPTYFKMMADVDMTGVDWEPVNYQDPYNKKIDFNGNGKTISGISCTNFKYPSIFGVLYGDVYDFTVEKATISGSSAMGVVAGYIGTGNYIRGSIKHVTVRNSTVTGISGDAKGAGIIAGRVQGSEIGACAAMNCTVNVPCNFPGGIAGYTSADSSYIHDCLFNGTVKGAQRIGGIMGMLAKNHDKIENCIAFGHLEGQRCLGGIVAHANYDKWDERKPDEQVIGCLAWNTEIIATQMPEDAASSGAIIGFTSRYNTAFDCWRSPDFIYSQPNGGFAEDATWNPGGMFNTFFNQNDFSETNPLPEGETRVKVNANPKYYRSPFNGKPSTVTASAQAKKIGWNEDIWDLSGDVPVLK